MDKYKRPNTQNIGRRYTPLYMDQPKKVPKQQIRASIQKLYPDLKDYRLNPDKAAKFAFSLNHLFFLKGTIIT